MGNELDNDIKEQMQGIKSLKSFYKDSCIGKSLLELYKTTQTQKGLAEATQSSLELISKIQQPLGLSKIIQQELRSFNDLQPMVPSIESMKMMWGQPNILGIDNCNSEEEEYWGRIDELNKQKNSLSLEEIETLLLAIDSGLETFGELRKLVPGLNSATLSFYSMNHIEYKYNNLFREMRYKRDEPYYFCLPNLHNGYSAEVKFNDDEKVGLSRTGKNLLYKLKKEKAAEERNIKSLELAAKANEITERTEKRSAVISIIISIIGAIVSTLIVKYIN